MEAHAKDASGSKGLTAPATDHDQADRKATVGDTLSKYYLLLVLLLLIVGFSIAVPDSFPTLDNFKLIANESVVIVFLAVAATLPLIVGEFDLSIGYVLGLSQALVVGFIVRIPMDIWLAIPIVLVICAGIGLINGILVVRLRINAFIATLATGSILTGFVAWYTDGQVIFENVPASFTSIARSELLGLPLPIYYALALAIAATLYFSFIPTGRRMYATGGSRAAAHLTGIKVNRLVLMSFVFSALLAGAAGIIIASRLGSAQPGLGPQFLLPAFAAAFLGATAIRPGRFNVLGSVIAVYVLAVPISGLQQLGVASWFEPVFNGAALIIAVALSAQIGALRQAQARRARLRAMEAMKRETADAATS